MSNIGNIHNFKQKPCRRLCKVCIIWFCSDLNTQKDEATSDIGVVDNTMTFV